MKTAITFQSAQGTKISITIEHDEPMTLSTELEQVEEKQKQAKEVIAASESFLREIIENHRCQVKPDNRITGVQLEEIIKENLPYSCSENRNSYADDLNSSLENQPKEDKRICIWCNRVFVGKSNSKYCSDTCRAEKAKADKAIWYKNNKNKPKAEKTDTVHKAKLKRCLKCMLDFVPGSNRQMICGECKEKNAAKNA